MGTKTYISDSAELGKADKSPLTQQVELRAPLYDAERASKTGLTDMERAAMRRRIAENAYKVAELRHESETIKEAMREDRTRFPR